MTSSRTAPTEVIAGGPTSAPGTGSEGHLPEAEVARRVEALAAQIAPRIDDETVVVCLLTGGIWFAADITRALARQGRNVRFADDSVEQVDAITGPFPLAPAPDGGVQFLYGHDVVRME